MAFQRAGVAAVAVPLVFLPGNMGGYVLVNRDVGEVLSVTFWNSEEDRAVAESEFEASPHRGRVSLYGVAMQESLRTA